jgi:putative hydrolase of the HAD superfamily
MPKLTDFTALTFDCYGTLIDWETGMIEALKPLTSRVGHKLTRNQILETHGRIEVAQQRFTPAKNYRLVLATVYKRMAEEWGVHAAWEECLTYGRSIGEWPAFEDTATALQYLKKFYKLVILSNVDNESFALSNPKLGVKFDAICTAEDIGTYKPAPQNFEYLLAHLGALGVEKKQILHTAESLFHDHRPANKFGLASCWIYRRHAQEGFGATRDPGEMPHLDFRFNSMGEMAAAHRQQSGG